MLNIRQKRETCTVLLYSIQFPNGLQRWWEWTRLATSLLGLKSDKRTLLAALLIDLLELAGLPSLKHGSFRIRTVEWVQGVIDSI
jgi:hypothetical protein